MGPATRPLQVHVSPAGNAFMGDIAAWIVEAAEQLGRSAAVVDDGSLPGERSRDALHLVVAPHEFFELSTRSLTDRRAAAARSISVATEQPGTSWFDQSVGWCRFGPVCLDINRAGAEALRAAGVDARWLRLGGVPSMDRRREGERSCDVTVLAGLTDSRARRLASLAPVLWPYRAELRLFPTDRPVGPDGTIGGPVFGADKYDLLADSRILLNLHRDDSTNYFEWARAVEAMANGCVVVTEPSGPMEPLVDGEHVIIAADVGAALTGLLEDPNRLHRIGAAAADLVHGELSLRESLGPVLDALDEVDPAAVERAVSSAPRTGSSLRASVTGRLAERSPARTRPAFRPHLATRRRLLDAVVAERALRRRIDGLRAEVVRGATDATTIVDSAAWAAATPDVSVIVTLFDYAEVVTETLDSVGASSDVEFEMVVVDDHSADDGRSVVAAWIEAHPELAVRLVGREANGGLAAARNLAIEHTRAGRVMVLDADNQVYPTCLRRLADALDADPAADMAWSILEVFGEDAGILSAHAWDPARLVERNVIDAQVMLRRSAWEQLGGYRELPGLLLGWEDWDLWLRMVASGRYGVLVPEMLGRYRSQGGSMVSGPNRFNDVMLERLEAAHPTLTFPQR